MRTAKQAAELAGCSVSTLRRYDCAWCGQSKLNQYRGRCGAVNEKCKPETFLKWGLSAESFVRIE